MPPAATARPPRGSLLIRAIHVIPILGQIARDIGRDTDNVFFVLVVLVTLVVLAVMTWEIVALAMTALALVPVMLVTLILLTRG